MNVGYTTLHPYGNFYLKMLLDKPEPVTDIMRKRSILAVFTFYCFNLVKAVLTPNEVYNRAKGKTLIKGRFTVETLKGLNKNVLVGL